MASLLISENLRFQKLLNQFSSSPGDEEDENDFEDEDEDEDEDNSVYDDEITFDACPECGKEDCECKEPPMD